MEQYFQDRNKIAIVGCGPAGTFCAMVLIKLFNDFNFNKFSITFFEKNSPLKTLLPTGNGRCNITNSIVDIKDFASNYPRGEKFLYSVFSRFSNADTFDFFNDIGIKTYTQDDGRVFPVSNSSAEVRNKLLSFLKKIKNVKFITKEILSSKDVSGYDLVVISAGSKGTQKLIKSFKHTCIPFKSALCSLKVKNFNYPKGVSVKSLDGDFIFTENGISGPLAFKLSSIYAYKKFPYDITINLFNYNELEQDILLNPKKSIGILVSKYVPKSLAKVIVDDFYKNAAEISKEKLKNYTKLKLTIVAIGSKGEIVHAGGVDLNEIDKNCKSKLNNNLWFCGEILNIDGFCGGFNLQNCWSTAYIVAKNIVESIVI